MGSFIAGVFATFVTLPLVGFYSIHAFTQTDENKRKSVHIATYITTVFLILSVHYAAVEILGTLFVVDCVSPFSCGNDYDVCTLESQT